MPENEQRALMLITDEPAQCRLISAIAAREGWRTVRSRDPGSAKARLQTRNGLELKAIIVDQCAAGEHACALIADARTHWPGLPILLLTAEASPLFAVQAMRAGASDYLIKPVGPDRLMHSLRAAAFRAARQDELALLAERLRAPANFESMIGAATTFREALAVAAKAARGNRNVLVEGECGTGKEMLVRAMQAASMRAKGPLQIVDIGTTPTSSIESVLFGHERDAFPGAFTRHVGALQRCDGGTLVIDEIDRLPAQLQLRMVEAIRHGSIRPVGAQHSFRVDVRLIAASNLPLRDLVAQGHFLPELLEAIAPVTVSLPPLRERSGDIAALARHFLARIGEQPGLRQLSITDGALAMLAGYDWPGNVRQLQAVLFRAAVFCNGDALTAADFPQLTALLDGGHGMLAAVAQHASSGVTLYTDDGNLRPLEAIELDVIRLAIGLYRGRMSEVAHRLGIGRSTLYRKLGELGIDNDPGKTSTSLRPPSLHRPSRSGKLNARH